MINPKGSERLREEKPETYGHRVSGALGGILHAAVSQRRLLQGILVLGIIYTLYFAAAILIPFFLALLLVRCCSPWFAN